MERCIEDLEYALRLLDKAAIARQARDASQRLRGLSRLAGGRRAPDSQSSGTVSEVKKLNVRLRVGVEFKMVFD